MESQPQNSEFRNNTENFHPCIYGMNGLHFMGRSAWVGYHLRNAGHEWATIYA